MEKKQLSFKKAKRLSVLKWGYITKNNGKYTTRKMVEEVPELEGVFCHCGFCERWKILGTTDTNCSLCELSRADFSCQDNRSIFRQWTRNYDSKLAEKLLEVIQ